MGKFNQAIKGTVIYSVIDTSLTERLTTGPCGRGHLALALLTIIIVRRAKAKWPRPQGPVVLQTTSTVVNLAAT